MEFYAYLSLSGRSNRINGEMNPTEKNGPRLDRELAAARA